MPQNFVINVLEIVVPAALGIVFIIAAAAVTIGWINKRGAVPSKSDAAAQARIEERLTHLTNAVEAMALEVERISEGQRFTTKLLSDNVESARAHEAAQLIR